LKHFSPVRNQHHQNLTCNNSRLSIIDSPAARRVVMGSAPSDEWMRTDPHAAAFRADMRCGQRITSGQRYTHENDNLDTFVNASIHAGSPLVS
jgi:hypothetical protein